MSLDVGPYSLDACTGDREVDTGEMMYVNYNANNSHGPASPRIVVPPLWRSEQDLSLSYDCGITKLPEPFDDFLYYPDGVPPPIYPDWLASLPLHGPAPKAFVERPLYATAASPPLEPPCIAPRDTLLFPDFGSVKAVSDLSTRNVPPLAHDDELIFNICEELDGNAFIHDSMGLFEQLDVVYQPQPSFFDRREHSPTVLSPTDDPQQSGWATQPGSPVHATFLHPDQGIFHPLIADSFYEHALGEATAVLEADTTVDVSPDTSLLRQLFDLTWTDENKEPALLSNIMQVALGSSTTIEERLDPVQDLDSTTSPGPAYYPYVCHFENCDKKFGRKGELTRHLKCVHRTSEVARSCPGCEKRFARADSMKRHLEKALAKQKRPCVSFVEYCYAQSQICGEDWWTVARGLLRWR